MFLFIRSLVCSFIHSGMHSFIGQSDIAVWRLEFVFNINKLLTLLVHSVSAKSSVSVSSCSIVCLSSLLCFLIFCWCSETKTAEGFFQKMTFCEIITLGELKPLSYMPALSWWPDLHYTYRYLPDISMLSVEDQSSFLIFSKKRDWPCNLNNTIFRVARWFCIQK